MSRPDRRPAALFAGALAVRALHAWRTGLPLPIVGDALEYHDFALHLVETGRYAGSSGELATRMPGFPLFLAACRALSGGSVAFAVAAQCVLSAATVVLLYRLAKRLLPDPWPLACAAFAAVYRGMVEPTSLLITETFFSFLLVASAWALYEASWSHERRAVLFGLLGGALYLVRPEPAPYLLATALALPSLLPGFKRKHVLSACAALALVAGVWTARNFAVLGQFLPGTTMSKTVGYLGLFLPAERLGYASGRHEAPAGMTELEREADFERARADLAARLTFGQRVKARLFNLATTVYPFLPEYDWTWGFAAPFALFGALLAAKRKALLPFAGAIACSWTVFMFFGGPVSRYRQGVAPFLLLLAAAGAAELWKRAGAQRARVAAGGWLAVNLAVWLLAPQARAVAVGLREALLR